MKVLFVNLVYGTGSTGKIIADIMNLLKKHGNDVKALYGTGVCSDNADAVKVSGDFGFLLSQRSITIHRPRGSIFLGGDQKDDPRDQSVSA